MDNYWSWPVILKNVFAGLIILANILLITLIRTSKKCRKQVGLNFSYRIKLRFLLFGQRFSLVIVSLAVIDMTVGVAIPISTLRVHWYRESGPLSLVEILSCSEF